MEVCLKEIDAVLNLIDKCNYIKTVNPCIEFYNVSSCSEHE